MAILGDTKAVSLTLLDGVIGNLVPKATDLYDLGTSTLKWRNIYGTFKGNADTATEFNTAASITLTGDTTGSVSSKKGWSIATTTKFLSGTDFDSDNNTALTTHPDAGRISYAYNIRNTTGLFDIVTGYSSNSILTLSRHNQTNYTSQLGFSSNGNIYYRNFNGSALDTTTAWKQLAFTDSNVASATIISTTGGSAAKFWRGDNTWSNEISGGQLKITANSNTITIGSQNASFTHIYNSASIPFIFNNTILTTSGNLGSTTYPFNNLYIGAKGSKGIYYVGTNSTNQMITFVDNTSDGNGNGIKIGGGGVVVVGAGESAANLSVTAGTETLYLTSDGTINIEAGGDTIANRIGIQVTAAGHVIPVKAEAVNNNAQDLGSPSAKWANIYGTTFSHTHIAGGSDGFKVSYGSTIDFFLGVGTGNETHGLYDNKASKWILYASTANTWAFVGNVTGNAATATKASYLSTSAIATEANIEQGTRTYQGSGSGWTGSIGSMQYAGILQVCGGFSRGWQIWANRGDNNSESLHWRNPNDAANAWNTERIIIDSGNYTNYTVQKDGTGASGSWGISIIGNATTATTASKLSNTALIGNTDRPVYFTANGVPAQTTYRMAGTNVAATTGITYSEDLDTGIWYVNGITSADNPANPGVTDGAMYTNKYSSSWIHEIYGDYRTGQIAVRGKNNGAWQAWRKILDDTNYSSYALPLSGGQMTGPLTWKNSNALPEKTSADYFLAIDAFANGGKTYWISKANVLSSIGAAAANHDHTGYLKWQTSSAASTALYDFGVYRNADTAAGTGPNNSNYYNIINVPYRKASGNTKLDWGWQLGNTTSNDNRMYYRTTGDNVAGDWQTIAHATTSANNIGSTTQPVYMTSAGVITACTAYANASVNYATSAGKISDISSSDAASSTATWRRIWFSYENNTTGRPAYSDNFAYQTSTGTLKTTQQLIGNNVLLQYNSTDQSLDFVFV